jgi:hypothetical protein
MYNQDFANFVFTQLLLLSSFMVISSFIEEGRPMQMVFVADGYQNFTNRAVSNQLTVGGRDAECVGGDSVDV